MKKFLLLIALIISGMGLFAQDAASATKVTDDDYFWLEEENITQTSASFIIKSIDDDYYYFFYCKVYTQYEFDSFEWDYEVYYATIEDGVSLEVNQTFTAHNLEPLTSYVAIVAFGVTGEYNSYPFSTLAAPSAGISIEVTDVTAATVSFSATPNSNTEKFYVTILEKTYFDSYSEEEWIDAIIEQVEPLSEGGEYTCSNLNPGTKYIIAAVALNEYGDPSELVSTSFTTEEGILEDGWWTVDYNGYSLDYVAFSSTECAVRGNKAPEEPTTINIPSEVSKDGKNYKVVQIYDNAFQLWKNAISFNLPTSIKKIGEYAFSECTSMDNLPIPESVEKIGNKSFYNSRYGNSLTYEFVILGDGVLYDYNGTVEDVVIPETVKRIGNDAFAYHSEINEITLPESIAEICDGAFYNCIALDTIDLSKVYEIGMNSFCNVEFLSGTE